MQEALISFETAKLAKEKGFNEPSIYYYNSKFELESICHYSDYDDTNAGGGCVTFSQFISNCTYSEILAPTQSLLQKWLFEQHNIWVNVQPDYGNTWWYTLDKFESTENKRIYGGRNVGTNKWPCGQYLSPYIALEEGLSHALTLILTSENV